LTKRLVEREEPSEPRRHAVVDGPDLRLVIDFGDVLDAGAHLHPLLRRSSMADRIEVRRLQQMRQLRSAAPQHERQKAGLPVGGGEELLVDVVADGFTLYCCGLRRRRLCWSRATTEITVVICLPSVILSGSSRPGAPNRATGVDIFAPEVVIWAYEGPPQHAVRALLDLVHPAHPDAPTIDYPAPAGLRVPRAQQRPMTI
jgi:hypothetical protein